LREQVDHWSWDDAWEPFEELARQHRHYSFFWMPSDDSAQLYGLGDPGVSLADRCHVKIYDTVEDDVPDSGEPYRRVGPAFRIYPMVYEPNFHELEYFVPFDRGREALAAMRELMLASLPASVFPMEVRTVGAEDAWLSHSYERETVVISVSGTCVTSTVCSASSTRASTGGSCTSSRRSSCSLAIHAPPTSWRCAIRSTRMECS
jgi:hypothetical protein